MCLNAFMCSAAPGEEEVNELKTKKCKEKKINVKQIDLLLS